jgi:hypothetical protein
MLIGAILILIDSGIGLREIIRLAKFSKSDFIIVGGLYTKYLLCHRMLGIAGKAIIIGRFFVQCRTPLTSYARQIAKISLQFYLHPDRPVTRRASFADIVRSESTCRSLTR